jgi:hypothetical protein
MKFTEVNQDPEKYGPDSHHFFKKVQRVFYDLSISKQRSHTVRHKRQRNNV